MGRVRGGEDVLVRGAAEADVVVQGRTAAQLVGLLPTGQRIPKAPGTEGGLARFEQALGLGIPIRGHIGLCCRNGM